MGVRGGDGWWMSSRTSGGGGGGGGGGGREGGLGNAEEGEVVGVEGGRRRGNEEVGVELGEVCHYHFSLPKPSSLPLCIEFKGSPWGFFVTFAFVARNITIYLKEIWYLGMYHNLKLST